MSSALTTAISNFLQWSEQFPEEGRAPGWESGYTQWPALRQAALELVGSTDPETAGAQPVEQILYIVARDNFEQLLVQDLISYPKWLLAIGGASMEFEDLDGRWQMAVALGASPDKAEAEKLLLRLNADGDEYVSRMALLALANIESGQTEALALKAWKTNDEYQRIAALWALKRIKSPNLPKYLQAARKDARPHLMSNVAKVE